MNKLLALGLLMLIGLTNAQYYPSIYGTDYYSLPNYGNPYEYPYNGNYPFNQGDYYMIYNQNGNIVAAANYNNPYYSYVDASGIYGAGFAPHDPYNGYNPYPYSYTSLYAYPYAYPPNAYY
jgi:hypothetical protein